MEGGKAVPFRFGSDNGAEWRLNYSNPIVSAFSGSDASNIESLGDVGTLDGGAAEYVLIWRIVSEAHIPLSDIEREWTFERMVSFQAFLSMKQDYKSAWTEFYERKTESESRKTYG